MVRQINKVSSVYVYKFFNNKYLLNVFSKKIALKYKRVFFNFYYYKRVFWLFWGFFLYHSKIRLLNKSCFNFLVDKYGLNLFSQDLKNVPFISYRKKLFNYWRVSLRLAYLFFYKSLNGAIILRATVNNFFLTFLRPGTRGEVGLYMSAGMFEAGISKKRRSVYVAKQVSQYFMRKLYYYYNKIKFLYLFFTGRLCKRTMSFLRVLSSFPFFVKNMFLIKNASHNGMRPPKRRRLKKLN